MAITLPRTGIGWQDEQHQTLFNAFSTLEKSLEKGDKSEIEGVILFLSDYVDDHFELEEKVMRENSYPNLAEHQAEHTRFQTMIEQIRANWFAKIDDDLVDFFDEFSDLLDGDEESIPADLYCFLSMWFLIHIKKLDQDLGKFMIQNKLS